MLHSLELKGFKSFADKTRFEFPPGITAVVGPNGSGKSNVVDAIRWVLGTQSVKSMRGKEMTDVIFNGASDRPPINMAEVTLVLDNAAGILDGHDKKVAISRRVYRSGEGEYFLNQRPCRLKDIRQLLAGTGIATEAYSIIEQGKVDVMLQASPRDRRTIFEEAAGISRFRARKVETRQRLERVQQNLLRLSDILEEVAGRLKRISTQANKAERYRTCSQRLAELQSLASRRQWNEIDRQLEETRRERKVAEEELERQTALVEERRSQRNALEEGISTQSESCRVIEARRATLRERMAELAGEGRQELDKWESISADQRASQLSLVRSYQQGTAVATKLTQARDQLDRATSGMAEATGELDECRREAQRYAEEEEQLTSEIEPAQREIADLSQQIHSCEKQASVLKSQVASVRAAELSCQERLSPIETQLTEIKSKIDSHQQKVAELSAEVETCGVNLRTVEEKSTQARKELAALKQQTGEWEVQRSGAEQRALVLEELERRLEGVSTATRELLERGRREPESPWGRVRGLVADVLRVEVEIAPLIEMALGPRVNYLVVDAGPDWLEETADQFPLSEGRIGVVFTDVRAFDEVGTKADLSKFDGVLDRLDRLVETTPENIPLVRRLLGRCWLVRDLAVARQLATTKGKGQAFVTEAGEMISFEGEVIVGSRQTATGILSRRSELEALRTHISRLDESLTEQSQKTDAVQAKLAQEENDLQRLSPEFARLTGELSEHRLRAASLQDRHEHLVQQRDETNQDLESAKSQSADANLELESAKSQLATLEENRREHEVTLSKVLGEREELSVRRREAERQLVEARVKAAKFEQSVLSSQDILNQLENAEESRFQAEEQLTRRIAQHGQILRQTCLRALKARSQLSQAATAEQDLRCEIRISRAELDRLSRTHREFTEGLEQVQQSQRQAELSTQEKRSRELQLEQERERIAAQLRDDFGIDVQNASVDTEVEQLDDVDEEIEQLQRQLANLGAVNFQAVEELDDLRARHEKISQQYGDLCQARDALKSIVERIEQESRRMFLATFETVRGHFSELFVKLFGGGQADVILQGEEDDDLLERGIEIVARPPGKEPRSISLLSGGEKTLTCVALLLAIFRSRPSPFCILDEVDAALDEANIDRFTKVLTDFLDTTQFVIITHSKRTMSCAGTLYGVTMQEKGITNRVAVQFDKVQEEEATDEAASTGTSPERPAATTEKRSDDSQAA